MTVPTPRTDPPGDGGGDSRDVVGLFRQVADEIGRAVRASGHRGESGGRAGQYAIDLVADEVVLGRLVAEGFTVLSEESGRTGPADAPLVVVDPVDGSTNASRGIPWFATALCLVDDAGPAVALVHNHGTGVEHVAVRGRGAVRDGEPIAVSGVVDLAASIVGVSGLPTHDYGWSQFRALGAAAPDLCAVADGTLDGWCDMSDDAHGVWDYLAGVLMVREAGGTVVDIHGRELCVLEHAARRTPVAAATDELCRRLVAARRDAAR